MKRPPLNLLLLFSLTLALLLTGRAEADKGRGYSSGGSSFSRGFSSSFRISGGSTRAILPRVLVDFVNLARM